MTVIDRLDGAKNVLLEGPSMGEGRGVCTALLTEGVATPNVLFVSFTRQPATCAEQLKGVDADVRTVAVVTVGETGPAEVDDVIVENVSSPSDLTGLGIKVGQFLSEWDPPVTVCFDSLTSLLQYVDFETAYEFLHAITGQVRAADARAHFHIDPDAHDPQAVAGITALVEASVSVADGSVRTRDVIG